MFVTMEVDFVPLLVRNAPNNPLFLEMQQHLDVFVQAVVENRFPTSVEAQ